MRRKARIAVLAMNQPTQSNNHPYILHAIADRLQWGANYIQSSACNRYN
jgi:hypothetical protein